MKIASEAKEFIEKTRQAIQSSKFDEAYEICSEGLRCHPDNLQLNINYGMILHHLGQKLEACNHLLGLITSYPAVAELELELASIALKNDDLDEAEYRIEAAFSKGGARSAELRLRADLANKKGDKHVECAILETIIKEADDLPADIAVRLARIYLQLKAYEKALGMLQDVLNSKPDNIKARAVLEDVAVAIGDASLAEQTLLWLIEHDPDNPKWYARLQTIYLQLGQFDKAEEVLREGLSRGLVGAILLSKIDSLPPIANISEQVLQWGKSVGDDASDNDRVVAQRALFHYAPSSFVRKAEENESSVNGKPTISDWLALTPADNDLKRPVTLESLSSEIQISRSPNSEWVVLVFLGLANQAMMPISIFDRFFAALDCTALYIRDNQRLLGNAGIKSVGETFEDTVRYLRNKISELGGRRLMIVGSSAGGFPALRYGLELGAEKILCFSGPTNVTAEFAADDGRVALVAKRLEIFPPEVLDMKPHVIKANGRSQIHLVYGDAHAQDTMHALHLQGCPEVHFHPLAGLKGHGSILELLQQRGLLPLLIQLTET